MKEGKKTISTDSRRRGGEVLLDFRRQRGRKGRKKKVVFVRWVRGLSILYWGGEERGETLLSPGEKGGRGKSIIPNFPKRRKKNHFTSGGKGKKVRRKGLYFLYGERGGRGKRKKQKRHRILKEKEGKIINKSIRILFPPKKKKGEKGQFRIRERGEERNRTPP